MFIRCAAALALSLGLQAHAAPASTASIEKMLQLTHAEQTLSAVWGPAESNMRQMIAKASEGQPVTPDMQARQERMIQRSLAVMHEQLNWDRLKPMFVKIYGDTFTQDEIDGLNTFYSSPAGQAYLAKLPLLMQHTMQLMQTQMQELMPRMVQAMRETAAEGAPASAAQ